MMNISSSSCSPLLITEGEEYVAKCIHEFRGWQILIFKKRRMIFTLHQAKHSLVSQEITN